MTTLTYPSPTFPGRPALDLELPDGWQPVPAAALGGLVLGAVQDGPPGAFRMNLTVGLDEVPAEHTVSYDLDGLAATAAERRDGVVGEPYLRNLSGVTFFGRDLSYVDDVAGTLMVSTLFGFVRHDVDRTLTRITLTGTVGSANHVEDYREVHAVMETISVVPAEGTTAVFDESGAA